MSATFLSRLKLELELLEKDPPPGIQAWPLENRTNVLEAIIIGPEETPYNRGLFKLEISLPNRYPFEPPHITFVTPIYHPNIDSEGRICLDILKMQPAGEWKPSLNLPTVLTSIRLLMSSPNQYDPLMNDINEIYKNNYNQFFKNAEQYTKKYAYDSKKNNEKEEEKVYKKRIRGEESPEDEPSSKSNRTVNNNNNNNNSNNNNFSNNNNNNNNGNGINKTTTTTTTTNSGSNNNNNNNSLYNPKNNVNNNNNNNNNINKNSNIKNVENNFNDNKNKEDEEKEDESDDDSWS